MVSQRMCSRHPYLLNGPKHNSCDVGNVNMPKTTCKVLSLREKVYILNLVRKNMYAKVAKIYGKNESPICEIA